MNNNNNNNNNNNSNNNNSFALILFYFHVFKNSIKLAILIFTEKGSVICSNMVEFIIHYYLTFVFVPCFYQNELF